MSASSGDAESHALEGLPDELTEVLLCTELEDTYSLDVHCWPDTLRRLTVYVLHVSSVRGGSRAQGSGFSTRQSKVLRSVFADAVRLGTLDSVEADALPGVLCPDTLQECVLDIAAERTLFLVDDR
ncbi:hypothetical protein WJX81_006748 [Elliptochloris bilobata]|uniref:Uncharacterized protein n=1 Tax=Elliptochloris bilobata TaxID=381761 RepID=A0AAW1RH61_9CHLO